MIDNGKLQLYGFNNLTKNLSFSFYKLHYLHENNQIKHYNSYINTNYNAHKLTALLTDICHAIGGTVLNVALQDYQPQGASVTLMISEEAQAESLVAHLDKSHICVHTYPEDNIQEGIAIFRADIELSTCGVISPLKVLNYLIKEFNADVLDIDLRIRGMTRCKAGLKQFIDQDIANISDFISNELRGTYQFENANIPNSNLYHTKLFKKNSDLIDNVFGYQIGDLTSEQQEVISNKLSNEKLQLFTNH